MFLEVDDGVWVNLDNVFSISYRTYQSRGTWVFSGFPGPQGGRAPETGGEAWRVNSRHFGNREEAEMWLRRALDSIGRRISDPGEDPRAARRRPPA